MALCILAEAQALTLLAQPFVPPTICPIVDPQGFDALNLFPLQINPHFTNALPEGHKGETREHVFANCGRRARTDVIGLPK
ncbi:peptidase E [Escherichia coli]|uniref:Peptidase E n=1 Tax=Escherichia coli TaxID=562 RepID=A0A376U0H3_ECOLX|nr:peptidase E [Escherichia coli]